MTLLDTPNPAPNTSFPSDSDAVRLGSKIPTTTTREQESTMSTLEQARSILIEPREPDSPRPPGEAASRTPVARCADGHGTMTGLFFSDNVIDIARAKAMCGLCPLKDTCLADALEREEPWGVWGGELLSGGRIIANKRPCGRPPKHPRPEVVIDELGPVPVAVA
ncbi:MAG: WhiB family transcriptional regulator [Ilumatobacteraceae bacterium]